MYNKLLQTSVAFFLKIKNPAEVLQTGDGLSLLLRCWVDLACGAPK